MVGSSAGGSRRPTSQSEERVGRPATVGMDERVEATSSGVTQRAFRHATCGLWAIREDWNIGLFSRGGVRREGACTGATDAESSGQVEGTSPTDGWRHHEEPIRCVLHFGGELGGARMTLSSEGRRRAWMNAQESSRSIGALLAEAGESQHTKPKRSARTKNRLA